jgi:hypothetical protein
LGCSSLTVKILKKIKIKRKVLNFQKMRLKYSQKITKIPEKNIKLYKQVYFDIFLGDAQL